MISYLYTNSADVELIFLENQIFPKKSINSSFFGSISFANENGVLYFLKPLSISSVRKTCLKLGLTPVAMIINVDDSLSCTFLESGLSLRRGLIKEAKDDDIGFFLNYPLSCLNCTSFFTFGSRLQHHVFDDLDFPYQLETPSMKKGSVELNDSQVSNLMIDGSKERVQSGKIAAGLLSLLYSANDGIINFGKPIYQLVGKYKEETYEFFNERYFEKPAIEDNNKEQSGLSVIWNDFENELKQAIEVLKGTAIKKLPVGDEALFFAAVSAFVATDSAKNKNVDFPSLIATSFDSLTGGSNLQRTNAYYSKIKEYLKLEFGDFYDNASKSKNPGLYSLAMSITFTISFRSLTYKDFLDTLQYYSVSETIRNFATFFYGLLRGLGGLSGNVKSDYSTLFFAVSFENKNVFDRPLGVDLLSTIKNYKVDVPELISNYGFGFKGAVKSKAELSFFDYVIAQTENAGLICSEAMVLANKLCGCVRDAKLSKRERIFSALTPSKKAQKRKQNSKEIANKKAEQLSLFDGGTKNEQ